MQVVLNFDLLKSWVSAFGRCGPTASECACAVLQANEKFSFLFSDLKKDMKVPNFLKRNGCVFCYHDFCSDMSFLDS